MYDKYKYTLGRSIGRERERGRGKKKHTNQSPPTLLEPTSPRQLKTTEHSIMLYSLLVGGFNPFEKY